MISPCNEQTSEQVAYNPEYHIFLDLSSDFYKK